jgi:uncharacterized protein
MTLCVRTKPRSIAVVTASLFLQFLMVRCNIGWGCKGVPAEEGSPCQLVISALIGLLDAAEPIKYVNESTSPGLPQRHRMLPTETLLAVNNDVHTVSVDGRRVLLHIPTTSLYELDALSAALLDNTMSGDGRLQFDSRFVAARSDLHRAGILLTHAEASAPTRPPIIPPSPGSLVSLVLNVNTGCNLSCSYCYKEDLAVPAKGRKMSIATALKSVDLLFAESGDRDRVSLVFFGGEPLTNLPAIRATVDYAAAKSRSTGKQVQFSLTTNATLVNEELADFFEEHRFGISVSMDGPKEVHDRHRLTVGGRGTYDLVSKKARLLLARVKSRPVCARVTLTHGSNKVVEIFDHLRNDIGFPEVGIAPATSAKADQFGMDANDRSAFFQQITVLGERYVEAAIRGEHLGFSNIHHMMLDLAQGNRKLVPCGAGVGLLAVDMEGGLNLCHRFTGSAVPTFGSLESGVDHARLDGFLAASQDRGARGCDTCRIRNLCSGGCYHENFTHTGDLLAPSYTHCDDLRQWTDFCIAAFVRIRARNPSFMRTHDRPRSFVG